MRIVEMIAHLEERGYVVTYDATSELDNVDAPMLEEIENLFLSSSCAERKEVYDKIIKICLK